MKITVHVKTNSKNTRVEFLSNGELRVSVKAPPREGRANEAVVRALAAHYRVPQSCISIVAGSKGKQKMIRIVSPL